MITETERRVKGGTMIREEGCTDAVTITTGGNQKVIKGQTQTFLPLVFYK